MMPGGPHQFGLSPRMMNQLNAQMTMAAAAAAAGQPPPGLGPRGALAGRMRFPGSYFMWSFFFLSNIPGVGFESLTAHLIRCAAAPSYQTLHSEIIHPWTTKHQDIITFYMMKNPTTLFFPTCNWNCIPNSIMLHLISRRSHKSKILCIIAIRHNNYSKCSSFLPTRCKYTCRILLNQFILFYFNPIS